MEFGWKEAGETLRAGGMGIVSSLLQESGRQKEEKRLIEREKRQFDDHVKKLDEAFNRNKDLHAYRKELDADYEMFGNNLDMKRLYDEAALPTASAEIKALVAGVEAIKFKQQNMISLPKEDYAFKQKLIELGYEGISLYIDKRELANARIIKKLETRDREYKTQLDIRRAREKEMSLARKLEAENKRLIIEQRKKRGKEEEVDAFDESMRNLVKALKEEDAMEWKRGGVFVKNVPLFDSEMKMNPEAKAGILKKKPELRLLFNEVEKHANRIKALGGVPKGQAEISAVGATKKKPGVEKDERGLVTGKIYEDEAGRKAKYLGKGQWEIIQD